jgi:hypothetical protein
LIGFDRTRKKKWPLASLFLLPSEENIVDKLGQEYRLR